MATNLKQIKIIIPNEIILKTVNSIPTLKRLSRLSLVVGENIETVNHYQFSKIQRMYPILGIIIKEI